MSLQVEKLEKNTAKLTIEVPAEQFAAAMKNAYEKTKNRYNIPGFRKGKAPYQMIKQMFGAGVFFEDAANEVIDATYPDAAKESGLDIVSRPSVSLEQIEEGKSLVYTATVAVKPEVTLGEYKGVEVQKAKAEVTDEDIEAEINRVREQNSRLITVDDRGVEDGDRVTIDFDGYVDGKRFDGGKSEDYPLVIGSHTFIDTFEEQLVGKLVGEECEVNVTFPEEYHVAELKSKPALFKVTVKEIQKKELPEVNDEFASEVSDFDTLEEYKKDLAEKLLKEKQTAAATANENKVVEKVVENATMEIPELMIDEQVNGMINNYARRIESQGISFKDYMEVTGMGIEKLAEQMRPAAIKNIETRLVLEAVVQAENLEASDEAIEEQFNKMAESYRMEKDEIKKMYEGERLEQMKQDLAVQEAIDFLVAEAKLAD
ncbi:MAG: trigger factor [Lachnospiraceae bacterium]|jgi:trigger factor|nr:trigger factor [Lachnospiraceae bacterium]NBJ80540.1 trigger factor [bacterium 1XD42-76]NBK03749.1 trigger factor [bacterium 1XD42-94]